MPSPALAPLMVLLHIPPKFGPHFTPRMPTSRPDARTHTPMHTPTHAHAHTGAGKTRVAIRALRALQAQGVLERPDKVAMMLTPSVLLCMQVSAGVGGLCSNKHACM